MLNMMDDDKKKMATMILSGSSSDSKKKEEGSGEDSYQAQVAGKLISAMNDGNKQDVVKYFKEMISCCDHGDSSDDTDA